MSLICLSSRGLSDSANNYTNFFGGRGIEFPKNSEICLVGASIKKHSPNDQVHTIPNEANTFAIHYAGFGSGNNDLLRDDVIVQEQVTDGEVNLGAYLEESLTRQMTCSPLRHTPNVRVDLDSAAPTGFTFQFPMSQCRNTLPGYWKVPKNLPFIAPVAVANGATGSRLTPTAGLTCWCEDSRKLFNTDNQGTTNVYGANIEGAKFTFTWTTGDDVALYAGMQGGIVTGNRLLDAYEPHSWVNNPNQNENDNPPSPESYQQKIDLGYEIQKGRGGRFIINIFKNTFVGNGYERQNLAAISVPPAGANQDITILFRPIVAGPNAGWEVATKIGAAPYALASLVVGTDDHGSPATATGNFPIGKYNGNALGVGIGLDCVQFWGKSNDKPVTVDGCYDDDPAIAQIAPPLAFPTRIYIAFSNISDSYAADNGVTANMRLLAQTRCNSSDSFGMASGVIPPPFGTTVGLPSDYLPDGVFNITDTPLCIQLPNLPITGFLGGGASSVGGATALPILGIVDAFELSRTTDGICIYEPTQENWIKLMNKDNFTINEIQVRITDLFGVLPDYLDTPTHVWVKIKAGTLEKV